MAKQEIRLTGKIELKIDENETTATIIFRRDEINEIWTAQSIRKLLLASNIADPVSLITIENNCKSWSESRKSEFSLVVASGIPPEETIHEKLQWHEFTIPAELEDIAAKLYAKAPPPNVYKIVKKKQKVEKLIKQKSLLPFLSKKEEKVDSWETVEEKIRGHINPVVKYKGFVTAQTELAVISSGRIGKPGKNIFNKVIVPQPITRIDFYYSQGVIQVKNTIKTTVQGFLRCGDNWADIIPFKTHAAEVKTSPDGKTCLLDFKPGGKDEPASFVKLIFEKATQLGFSQAELVTSEQIQEWLTRAVQTETDIKAKILNAVKDATIEIFISADKSEALLNLTKGSGAGKQLELSKIGKEINKLKIKNLNREELKKIILQFYQGTQKELIHYCLARGTPPVRGKDGKLDFICTFLGQQATNQHLADIKKFFSRIKLESELKFPLENISQTAAVKKDETIAKILPPSHGEPGVDIFGNPIPSARGNDPDLRLYENIILSKNAILSNVTGILEFGKNNDTILLRVRSKEEAQWEITFSKNKTKAFLSISPPHGLGSAATLENIQNEITSQGITRGLKTETLTNLIARAAKGETIQNAVIAEGRPPIDGSGQRLLFHVKIVTSSDLESQSAGSGEKDNADVLIVSKGSVIAEIFPPAIPPIAGWSVTGETLAASHGVEIEIQAGTNVKTQQTENASRKFIAQTSGEVIYDGKSLSINPQQIIHGNVGPKTGNISASGSLLIEGSVIAGFKVFSKGNITIRHKVQQAVISADGSIQVEDQIVGKHRTILRAKKNIRIKAAASAIFLAVGNMIIEELCLHSTIKCNGAVKTSTGHGTIAGGIIKARMGLNVHTLGTTEGRETSISFGQNYLISDQIEIEEKEVLKLNNQIIAYDQQMNTLEQAENKDMEKLYQLRKAKRQTYKIIEKRNYRLFMLHEKYEEHFPSEIIIHGTIYPGVSIESHGRNYKITQKKEKIIIFFNTESGKIEEKPL